MSKKRSFIELITRKPNSGTGSQYLPKDIAQSEEVNIEQQPNTELASQKVEGLASQSDEIWQATGKPTQDWQASSGKPSTELASQKVEEQASQNQSLLASQNINELASQKRPKRYSRRTNRIAMTVRYSPDIYNEIKSFCELRGIDIQDFCELAASHYMNALASHDKQVLASQIKDKSASQQVKKSPNWQAHDDLMIYKSHDDIIMLFKHLTGRKWGAGDDRMGAKFNSVDRRLIEIGMIHTFLQARGKKINSFAYFVPEIQTMIEANFDKSNLDVYVRSRRKMLNEFFIKQGRKPIYELSED